MKELAAAVSNTSTAASEPNLHTEHRGAGDGFVVVDKDGRIFYANDKGRALWHLCREMVLAQVGNISQAVGEVFEIEVPTSGDSAMGTEWGSNGRAAPHEEHGHRERPGASISLEVRLSPTTWEGQAAQMVMLCDISGRRAQQALAIRLALADKRAAIAQIVRSVSHEINNPAAFMLTNLAVMRDIFSDIEAAVREGRMVRAVIDKYQLPQAFNDLRSMVEDNTVGMDRSRQLLDQVHALAQESRGHIIDDSVDVSLVAATACDLVAALARKKARLVRNFAQVPAITAKPFRLLQAVCNIVQNGIEAVAVARGIDAYGIDERIQNFGSRPDDIATQLRDNDPSDKNRPGGRHDAIEADVDDNEDDDGHRHQVEVSTSADDKWVRITVTDTGCGIPQAHRERIFDPLFIANADAGAIGVGLSIAREIAAEHGGHIEVKSEIDLGSRFSLVLPHTTGLTASMDSDGTAAPGEVRARVLLIADEEALLSRTEKILAAYSDVVSVSGGAAALDLLERDKDFDAVVCALVMGDLGGPQVYESIQKIASPLTSRMIFLGDADASAGVRRFVESSRAVVLDEAVSSTLLRDVVERKGR